MLLAIVLNALAVALLIGLLVLHVIEHRNRNSSDTTDDDEWYFG